jgi:acyl-homoserine lactone acylase PvdQ
MRRGLIGAIAALAALVALPATAASAAGPPPGAYQENDATGFHAILPPGTNGLDNPLQLASFLATGARPAHNHDQWDPYANLLHASPGLDPSNLGLYYHDASFGVPQGEVERTYSPRDDVTIERDNLGVPHVYGSTRAGAMFGLGYAAAEDRLFFMDVLRHAGRAELSSFAGGSPGNREMDASVWADTPYTEQDLQRQCAYRPHGFEAQADALHQDEENYIAGINQYISEARLDQTKMPGEYAAIGQPQGPTDWSCPDVVATASLVGGIFGKGGGNELNSALTLEEAQQRFGRRGGKAVWRDFREANDPEAPTTMHKKKFPYEAPPRRKPKGLALPDPGSTHFVTDIGNSNTPPPAARDAGSGILGPLGLMVGNNPQRRPGASNALLVSARESQSGHPVAVMGPQVAYFAPQILMEEDVHAPTIDARGAAFPGVNLFVQLGRGRDYAWSATSAGQDVVDSFAVPLCDPDHYRFRGQCLPFEVLTRTDSWTPNLADSTPAGSQTLIARRTKLGIVIATGKVHGKPVVFTKLRSTYFHEVDSALGFSMLNNPDDINGPKDFQKAASLINYTFNWFYIDDKNIAYYNSGWNPVRAKGTDPNFPVLAKFPWKGLQSDSLAGNTPFPEKLTPPSRHPQVINQNYITSWNNKQAKDYRAADDNWAYGPVFRSTALDERVKGLIKGGRKATVAGLVDAMEGAATVDLDGHTVLPYALKIMRRKPITDPALANAVSELADWSKSGAHRIDTNHDGHYEHSDAIRLMDAWWKPLMHAEFEPTLGATLFSDIEGMSRLDDAPNQHLGSAYDGGWYVYANKDLRTILRPKHVKGRFSRIYCGKGKIGRCRNALLNSLASVLNTNPYGENAGCGVGDDQMCFDAIHYRSTGGITQPDMEWQNRPTFQQTVEIPHAVP